MYKINTQKYKTLMYLLLFSQFYLWENYSRYVFLTSEFIILHFFKNEKTIFHFVEKKLLQVA